MRRRLKKKKKMKYTDYTGGDFCENFPLKKKTSVKILNRKSNILMATKQIVGVHSPTPLPKNYFSPHCTLQQLQYLHLQQLQPLSHPQFKTLPAKDPFHI
jgi:hypothetical protein